MCLSMYIDKGDQTDVTPSSVLVSQPEVSDPSVDLGIPIVHIHSQNSAHGEQC